MWNGFVKKMVRLGLYQYVANKWYIRFIMGHGGGDLYRLILMAHIR